MHRLTDFSHQAAVRTLLILVILLASIVLTGTSTNAYPTSSAGSAYRLEAAVAPPELTPQGSTTIMSFTSYINKSESNIPWHGLSNVFLKRQFWIENGSGVMQNSSTFFSDPISPTPSNGDAAYPFYWWTIGGPEKPGNARCITPGQGGLPGCPNDQSSVTDQFRVPTAELRNGYRVCTLLIVAPHFGGLGGGTPPMAISANGADDASGYEDMFGSPPYSGSYSLRPSPPAHVRSEHSASYDVSAIACTPVTAMPPSGTFQITPTMQPPQLNDDEAPTTATFSSSASVSVTPSSQTVNGVTFTRSYYIRRGGSVIPIPGNPSPEVLNVNSSSSIAYNDVRNNIAALVQTGDQVCASLTVAPGEGEVNSDGSIKPGPNPAVTDEKCQRIYNKPYFRVYGGDVIAGSGFGESCDPTANPGHPARIIGFGEKDGRGSAAQLAAQAIGKISGFSTATLVGRVPKGLSFSNTAGDATYGGAFSDSGVCAHNYFSDRSGYTQAGPTIGAQYQNIAPGSTIRLYRDGDVTINQDITYNLNGWTPSSMPSFYLVVRGDIYISRNVERLDGVFIAQPKEDGTGGVIYTCTMPGNSGLPSSSNDWESCEEKRLTVNGSFIAQKIKLYRTRGSMRESSAADGRGSGNPAELFIYSPEIWMASPNAGGLNVGNYDSITSLPPVL